MTLLIAALPLRYIVLASSPVVAEDIAEAIRETSGPGDIEIALRPDSAIALIRGRAEPSAVFAVMRAQAVHDSGIAAAISGTGGRLVLVGSSVSPDEAAAQGWILLPEPFSGEMVEDVLRRLRAG